MSIYEYSVMTPDGKEVSLKDYEGRPVLIVNTASKCGFTPQFKDLQALYSKYKDKGFVILGFPSDQFMNQEFDEINDTLDFCQKNYGVTFPMFAKVEVKGKKAHPLFTFLTSSQKGLLTSEIKWNFTKFLVDREGFVVKRYAPQASPTKIEPDLQELL